MQLRTHIPQFSDFAFFFSKSTPLYTHTRHYIQFRLVKPGLLLTLWHDFYWSTNELTVKETKVERSRPTAGQYTVTLSYCYMLECLLDFVLFQLHNTFLKKCYLFLNFGGCAGSSLLLRLFSSWGTQASHCGGFSCCRAWALGHTGFSSCSIWAQ